MDKPDGMQDSSTHSFTDGCASEQEPLEEVPWEELQPRGPDQEEDAGEEIAELYLDSSFTRVPKRNSSSPATSPVVLQDKKQIVPFLLSCQQELDLLNMREKKWAAKISATTREICMLCLLLLGISCMD